MRGRLNLASRPFRNEALPNLLFTLGTALALSLSVLHGLHLRGLLGESASALHQQIASQQAELARLRGEAQALRVPAPEGAQLAEWRTVKELVDRRTFSWTLLLSRLESVIPPGIRLQSIAPRLAAGQVQLELRAVARSREDGFDFARGLQDQGSFRNVYPAGVDHTPRGEEFTLVMVYRPPAGRP